MSENNLRVPAAPELECKRPKRVYPYHIWLPFSKYTPYYEVEHLKQLHFETKRFVY